MHQLSKTVRQFVDALPSVNRVIVAFSGGVDSTVLLHATVKAGLNQSILAIHINHRLSENATAWQNHCAQVCADLNVPHTSLKVTVAESEGGVEQAAREARLKAISEHLAEGDLLLMGHHQEDQLETFFLRLIRGSGLRGLSCMAPVRPMGSALLGRPLLTTSKVEIEAYAKEFKLCWVTDESNGYIKFDRNFLRLHILPSLQSRWPTFAKQVSKTTNLLTETETLLEEYAHQDLVFLKPRFERVGSSVKLNTLAGWSLPRRNAVIRSWLLSLQYRVPSKKQLAEIELLMDADVDKEPLLNWVDCEMRRYRGRLYCLPKGWENKPEGIHLNYQAANPLLVGETRIVPRCGAITLSPSEQGLNAEHEYHVILKQNYHGSSRCQPFNRIHSQKLKKLLQEYKLEPWLRDRIPLVMAEEQLAAVGDLWVESEFYSESSAVSVSWIAQP